MTRHLKYPRVQCPALRAIRFISFLSRATGGTVRYGAGLYQLPSSFDRVHPISAITVLAPRHGNTVRRFSRIVRQIFEKCHSYNDTDARKTASPTIFPRAISIDIVEHRYGKEETSVEEASGGQVYRGIQLVAVREAAVRYSVAIDDLPSATAP